MKYLIKAFPMENETEKIIEFDAEDYGKKNNCTLLNKQIVTQGRDVVLIFEVHKFEDAGMARGN